MKNSINFAGLIFLISATILHSCKKHEVPTLKTVTVTNITGTTATSGGWIIDEGSGTIVERGVCWSKGISPTVEDYRTIEGGGAGTYISIITNLDVASTYYVRAYATNVAGTGYGMAMAFMTMGHAPNASTLAATDITAASATLRGAINANYLSTTVTFEYGTTTGYGQTIVASPSPVAGNSNTEVTGEISGLEVGTNYHYRVKAVNALGTTNGEDMSFITLLSDIDGNVYKVVTIGTQVWMAENLKVTEFNDHTSIPLLTDNTAWSNESGPETPGYCWYRNDEVNHKDPYGALYNWYTVNTGKLCPTGWHVPTDAEWIILADYLGGKSVAGGKLYGAKDYWLKTARGADNSSGFTAVPGGIRSGHISPGEELGINCYLWSSTEYDINNALVRGLNCMSIAFTSFWLHKADGCSVRCVKDKQLSI